MSEPAIKSTWKQVGLIVAAPLVLYLFLYLAMLERKVYVPAGVDPHTGQNIFEIEPQYRIRSLTPVFGPIHRLDRRVREDYWTTIESNGATWKNPTTQR